MRDPNRTKLGRRQKKMLDDMYRHGEGQWLSRWYMSAQQAECMDSLVTRGLVVPVDGNTQATFRLVGSSDEEQFRRASRDGRPY